MFDELTIEMHKAGWAGLDKVKEEWDANYKNRKIISEFIQDDLIGKKRLASMPDRITNTINAAGGKTVLRPTVINCYEGDLSTQVGWWKRWLTFMFHKKVEVSDGTGTKEVLVRDMLPPIRHAKYPSISEEEEAISVPLQTLCVAIFDAILVNMLNSLSMSWQELRNDMCNKLNRHKVERSVEILSNTYWNSDVMFLQEVATVFVSHAEKSALVSSHSIHVPAAMDADRDQNSIILLKRGIFSEQKEMTDAVVAEYAAWPGGGKLPLEKGDLFVLSVTRLSDGVKFLLASFHGDTNGLATIPVVKAVQHYLMSIVPDHKLLFGMDANTYASPSKDQQGVVAFAEFYRDMKLNSCYGPTPNPLNFTTFHARTFLQTQLNKAITLEEKDIKGDKNPKDFIVFFNSDFKVLSTKKDNTGDQKYVEGMVFPTLKFPSDHGVTMTILQELKS
jgi:hypothetical protein